MNDLKAQVTRVRVKYVSSLPTENILKFLKEMSSAIPEMKYPDHDEEKKRFKVTTNRGSDWKSEVHAIASEATIEIAWGPEVDNDTALQHVKTFGDTVANLFDEFLIKAFDCNIKVDTKCKINPYLLFEGSFYNSNLLSQLKTACKNVYGSELKTYDNDVNLIYGIGNSLVLAINLYGTATHDEVQKAEYSEDTEIQVSAGLLETDPKSSDTSLASRLVDHTKTALALFDQGVFPYTLKHIRENVDSTKGSNIQ